MPITQMLGQALLAEYSRLIARLRAAVLDGELSESDRLKDRWNKIAHLTDGGLFDSAREAVEFEAEARKKGVAMETVGDLLRYLASRQSEGKK